MRETSLCDEGVHTVALQCLHLTFASFHLMVSGFWVLSKKVLIHSSGASLPLVYSTFLCVCGF